ncbi:hypothetical protein [Thermospira aquatica]|uniref:Uncharacterized protein n=1 Tax=Thermospira aquatica TaxID=2828656 RepID=A0AAX3BG20_9SPIR|nr:hypothetical protein [Thermospira aquatica]URA10381.1 hypothetical protein KDW03_00830 [Thermospira aquatica]
MRFGKLVCFLLVMGNMWGKFVIDEPGAQNQAPVSRPVFGGGARGVSLDMLGSVNTFDALGRAVFGGKIFLYENGGFGLRFQVGIFDVVDIGISEGIENLIGVGNPQFFIPGAYVKLQIIKNLSGFSWAVGFDTFGYGRRTLFKRENGTEDMLYGFYSVAGWKFQGWGSQDYLLFGVRFPLLPAEMRALEALSLMGGISIHLGPYFFVSGTLEHLYFSEKYQNRFLPSLIAGFVPSENFELQVLFQYLTEEKAFHRSLSLGYKARF